jgi:AraC family transcriptional activator of pobA
MVKFGSILLHMQPVFRHYSIGHFINEPRNTTPVEVTFFNSMAEPDVEENHKHTFYELIWVEKGRSKQVIDFREYKMSAGSIFFISPGQVHRFEEWRGVIGGSLLFTGEFFLLGQESRDQLFELIFLDNIYFRPDLRRK